MDSLELLLGFTWNDCMTWDGCMQWDIENTHGEPRTWILERQEKGLRLPVFQKRKKGPWVGLQFWARRTLLFFPPLPVWVVREKGTPKFRSYPNLNGMIRVSPHPISGQVGRAGGKSNSPVR